MPLTAHYKTKIYLGSQSAGVGTKGGSEIARKEKREGKLQVEGVNTANHSLHLLLHLCFL